MRDEALFEGIAASWRPASVEMVARLDAAPVTRLEALFGRDASIREGDALPLGWHWLHYVPSVRQDDLGEDGHPRAGAFLPPFEDRRRMMAGGRLRQHEPLLLGETYTRRSELTAVKAKRGRTGEMLFVTVHHVLTDGAVVMVEEWEDVVYRHQPAGTVRQVVPEQGNQSAAGEDPADGSGTEAVSLRCDPASLFRFSALTFNAHRIHYDLPYASDVENYPGLVVHGPLLAMLMLEPARRAGLTAANFEYRLLAPLFAGDEVSAVFHHDHLRGVATASGTRTMAARATVDLRPGDPRGHVAP